MVYLFLGGAFLGAQVAFEICQVGTAQEVLQMVAISPRHRDVSFQILSSSPFSQQRLGPGGLIRMQMGPGGTPEGGHVSDSGGPGRACLCGSDLLICWCRGPHFESRCREPKDRPASASALWDVCGTPAPAAVGPRGWLIWGF